MNIFLKLITLNSICLFLLNDASAQYPKKIVVEHFTNTRCIPCAYRNPGFFENLSKQENIIHISYYAEKPFSSCLFHQHNPIENEGRAQIYNIKNAPLLVIQGELIDANADYSNEAIFKPYQNQETSISIDIQQDILVNYNLFNSSVVVRNSNADLKSLKLFVGLAEQLVFFDAPNGEVIHHNVFRKAFTHTTGNIFTENTKLQSFSYSTPLHEDWNLEQMFVFAIIQDTISKEIIAAEAAKPQDLEIINDEMNCIIGDVQVEIHECPQTYSADVKVTFKRINNGSKGYSIYLDDERIYTVNSYEEYDSLGFAIIGPLDCYIFVDGEEISVFDNEFGLCHSVSSIDEIVNCYPEGNCKINNLELLTYPCDSTLQFAMDVSFDYEFADPEGFSIFANEVNIGTFKYGDLYSKGFVTTQPLATDDTTNWVITVADSRKCQCEDTYQLGTVYCNNLNCTIQNLTATAVCPDTDIIEIDFEYKDPNNSIYNIYFDREKLDGFFRSIDFPLQIVSRRKVGEVKIVEIDNAICFARREVDYSICNSIDNTETYINIIQSNDILTISTPRHIQAIHIFDLTGRTIYTNKITDASISIDIQGLSKGLKIVQLQSNNLSIIKKTYFE